MCMEVSSEMYGPTNSKQKERVQMYVLMKMEARRTILFSSNVIREKYDNIFTRPEAKEVTRATRVF